MKGIYRCHDRLDYLGIKYVPSDNKNDFEKCIFKDSPRPTSPIEPIAPIKPNEPVIPKGLAESGKEQEGYAKAFAHYLEAVSKYESEHSQYLELLEKYNKAKAQYDERIALMDSLDNRPDLKIVEAVRKEIGIIDGLADLIKELVSDPKAEFIEDDYHATIWNDPRPMPSLEEILSGDTRLKLAKTKAKIKTRGERIRKENELMNSDIRNEIALGIIEGPELDLLKIQYQEAKATEQAKNDLIDKATTIEEVEAI